MSNPRRTPRRSSGTPASAPGGQGASARGAGSASSGSGNSHFPQRPVRRSALVSPWGIGAMVDFPHDEALMTAGLDAWPFALKDCPPDWQVTEERLQKRLGVSHFRLPPDFRKPGPGIANPLERIPFVRFPQFHYCPRCGHLQKLTLFGGRQRCEGPPWGQGLACDSLPPTRRPHLLPVRFVAVCSSRAHIQDFPFLEWVHRRRESGVGCKLRLRAGRSAAGLAGIKIECLCGQSESMAGAFNEGALDKIAGCAGQRPWMGESLEGPLEDRPSGCGCTLRVVQRGASNTYFPHVASSIYLPLWGENVRRPIVEALEDATLWRSLTNQMEEGRISLSVCKIVCDMQSWRGLEAEELRVAAQRRHDEQSGISGQTSTTPVSAAVGAYPDKHAEEEQFRFDEYAAMRSGKTVQPELEMSHHQGEEYDTPVNSFFRTVTLVRKLRETRALYGFSRYVPDDGRTPTEQIGELRLHSDIDWLPAVVTRGEGLFFELDAEALTLWENGPGAQRAQGLIGSMAAARARRAQSGRALSPKFVLLHTLAHLLINQLAFDCGYGSSSLRERIYCDGTFEDRPMNGFLIYTASGDAEGTMGGLVRQGQAGRIEETLFRAIKRAMWCSYDPVCLESSGQGPDNCNRAACHGCAILPETSCEEGNRMLDRVAIVGTPEAPELGYFSSFIRDQWA